MVRGDVRLGSLAMTVVFNAIVSVEPAVLKIETVRVMHCGMDQPAKFSWVCTC